MSNLHLDSTDLTWLGRLASALLRERSAAEDLVQDTVVAALQGNPPPHEARRSWLAAVARRLAARRLRTDSRRTRREARLAEVRPESPPDAGELVARAELSEQLSAAARSLPEPFRRTILLRFLEGLSTAEIAEREAAPADTVRFRVRRGLALLRTELKHRHGDWSKCCVLLYPLARPYLALDAAAVGSSSSLAGGGAAAAAAKTAKTAATTWILMKTKWMAALAVAIACGGGWWLASQGNDLDQVPGSGQAGAGAGAVASSQPTGSNRPGTAAGTAANVTTADRSAAAASRQQASTLEPRGIAVTVVNRASQPIPNATAYLLERAEGPSADGTEDPEVLLRTTSDTTGKFFLPASLVASDLEDASAPPTRELRVVANGYLRHLEASLSPTEPQLRIVLQPGRELRGRVVDTDGRPVPQLALLAHSATKRLAHVSPSKVLMRATSAQLRMSVADYEHSRATTDQLGQVAFTGLPTGELSVRCVDPGWTMEGPDKVGSNDRDVTWIVRRRLGVELTVVDEATGMPVETAHAIFKVKLDFADGETQDLGEWVGSGTGKVSLVLGPGTFLPDFKDRIVTRAEFYGAVGTSDDNRTEWRAPALQDSMGASGVARLRVAVDLDAAKAAEQEPLAKTELELTPRFDDGTPFVGRLYVRWETRSPSGRTQRGSESAILAADGRHRLRVPAGAIRLAVAEGNASGSLPAWRGNVYGYADRVTIAQPVIARGATATIIRPADWTGHWFVHASWRPAGETAWRGSWNYSTDAAELELRALSTAEWRFQLRLGEPQGPDPVVRTANLTAGASVRVED